MSAPTSPTYAKLVAKTPPRIVRSQEQNELYTAVLYDLTSCRMTKDEREFADTHALD